LTGTPAHLIYQQNRKMTDCLMLKSTPPKNRPPHLRLSEDQTTELADMFRLMSDPSRLRIILSCLETPISVGDMANALGLSASLVSHHLRLLRAGRLIQAERRGNRVFYLITDEHIRRVLSDMVDHVSESTPDIEGV
jgi:ArsR family transcriptional regulator, lead/cadmium/zinc/bismuth-responsive transcriptional repressor